MSKVRIARYDRSGFGMISNKVFKDENLSSKAKYYLIRLLNLPDDWVFTASGFCSLVKEGIDGVNAGLRELEANGYLVREKIHGDSGKYEKCAYRIYEDPSLNEEFNMCEDCETEKSDPDMDNPIMEKPFMENPIMDNPVQHSTKEQKQKIVNIDNYTVCRLTDSEYDDLVKEFGKDMVDYQLNRINKNHYKGCDNYKTVKQWCQERWDRMTSSSMTSQPKKNDYHSFMHRDDYETNDQLEKELLANYV